MSPIDFNAGFGAGRAPEYRPDLIVARRVGDFSRQRRELFHSLARQLQMDPPPDGEALFDAIDAGRQEEVRARFEALRGLLTQAGAGTAAGEQAAARFAWLWPALLEPYLVVTTAWAWPAQSLLEFGRTLLGCLRPGMIYLGGTNPGRAIPTLLDETGEWSETGRHIVLTQNALGDASYLEYVQFRFGDQIAALSRADAEQAQRDYTADLGKRRDHDAHFPAEPAQVRPGEELPQNVIAAMSINEKLLQTLLERNPHRPFALEESFPFSSLHADAVPLGPVLELRARRGAEPLSQEHAAEAARYWQKVRTQVLTSLANDPRAAVVRACYAKLALAQAGLLLHHQHRTEAEQIFGAAAELDPAHPEVVFRYANLLLGEHRLEEASALASRAAELDPANASFQNLSRHLDQMNRG